MKQISIAAYEYADQLLNKIHLINYMQNETECLNFGQLVDFNMENGLIYVVQEHFQDSLQVETFRDSLKQRLSKDFVKTLTLEVLNLHSRGIFGLKFDHFYLDEAGGCFKWCNYLDHTALQQDCFDLDLEKLAQFLKEVTEADDALVDDLRSGYLTIFEVCAKHFPASQKTAVSACRRRSLPAVFAEYNQWKSGGRNAIREYNQFNKEDYYPISHIPESSNSHSKSAPTRALHKSIIVDLTSCSDELQEHYETMGSRWFQSFNATTKFSEEYLRDQFDGVEKYAADMYLDRQLEVDLPRCHSYNALISSADGQFKLRRLIKAFLKRNPTLVYWQGLDSISATFLCTFYYQDHLALYALDFFVANYLTHFFIEDNTKTIQSYLLTFQSLLSYVDPELSTHLAEIGFWPDLYAIPWFLTFFSHVLSLNQLVKLWDSLFRLDSYRLSIDEYAHSIPSSRVFSMFTALSLVKNFRSSLLSADFQECIHAFGEMNLQPDIELVTEDIRKLQHTFPPSIFSAIFDLDVPPNPSLERRSSVFGNGRVRIPSIFYSDSVKCKCVIVDMRSSDSFMGGHLPGSISIPCWLDIDRGVLLSKIGIVSHLFEVCQEPHKFKCIVLGDQDAALEQQVATILIESGIPGVMIMQGGMDSIKLSTAAAQSKLEVSPFCYCHGMPMEQVQPGDFVCERYQQSPK